jgi:hypothetical protein
MGDIQAPDSEHTSLNIISFVQEPANIVLTSPSEPSVSMLLGANGGTAMFSDLKAGAAYEVKLGSADGNSISTFTGTGGSVNSLIR